ncbi:MAG: hypothetical protein J3Q66DRAFT_365332 [Benniella sp.]|nr:MAG: hypothetical protein J3Q66DRAFT_365332 [Benniella sp.]
MVRIGLLTTSALAVASLLVPIIHACEHECRAYPVEFLVEKYTEVLHHQLGSLPVSENGRYKAEALTNQAVDRLHDVIDSSIFSRFHTNCHDKPPRRSPDEICGSAKSIACFAPWGHRNSVFDGVHSKVVRIVEETFRGDKQLKGTVGEGVKSYCPGQCKDWEKPFQELMLKWEEKEHHIV